MKLYVENNVKYDENILIF